MTSPQLTAPEMAAAALSCEAFADAVELAAWLGPGRELTASGVLRPAVAVQACQALGIPLASGKLRSAMDVPELDRAWTVARAAGLVLVAANRTSTRSVAAGIAAAAAEAKQLEPGLADQVILAWLCAASEQLGFPDDICGECLACLAGEGACPPEDCGGAGGYWNLKEALANAGHHDHENMLEWLGLDDPSDFDAAEFDLAEVNERLRG